MKLTKEIEKLEKSAVKLTVTIGKKDVAAAYTETVNKYAKNVQIPGFRKGKAPVSVLENKFGEALKNDATADLVEKALGEIFDEFDKEDSEARPIPYAQPALEAMPKMETNKDLKFVVTYDVFPKVEVTDLSGIEVEEAQVSVTDDDIADELNDIRERNAMVIDKDDGAAIADKDIVTMNYCELDDKDAVIDGSSREDFVCTMGTNMNLYKFDDEIIGMKKGDTKDITKTFAEDFEDKDLAGKTKKIRVTVTGVKVKDIPELDDDLAQDVNEKYKTVDDLKNALKKDMANAAERRVKEKKTNELIEKLIEKYPFELPQSLLSMELENRWRMIAQQFQTTPEQLEKMVLASGQTRESMITQWTGDAEKNLKGRVIVESLLKVRDIKVTPEEVEAEYAVIADKSSTTVEEVKKHYADPRQKEYLIDDIKETKLYDQLFAEIKVTKGKAVSFKELFQAE
ncbi:MAG: trigger factor [Treponemataceae bacterium]|nr:trigger factor [Treponemataceae bacterium]